MIPQILPEISPKFTNSPPTSWKIKRVLPSLSDMTVIMLGVKEPEGVLKLPKSDQAMMSLEQQIKVLEALHVDARLSDWRSHLPAILAKGDIAGQPYIVEQMLPGVEAEQLLYNAITRQRMQATVVAAIGELHRRTAKSTVVDNQMLKHWLYGPVVKLRKLKIPFYKGKEQALLALVSEVQQSLAKQRVTVSWVHGDFAPRNILVSPDGSRVTGIIDWEDGRENDLPQIDLIQFLLSSRMIVQNKELGDVIIELLREGKWTADEEKLLNSAQDKLPSEGLDMRTMLILCWLRHISANLKKSQRYTNNWLWVRKNIEKVLRAL